MITRQSSWQWRCGVGRPGKNRRQQSKPLLCVRGTWIHPDDSRALVFGAGALVEQAIPKRAMEWV
jgi:hypothetical protein